MNSPLKRTTSVGTDAPSPRNGREMAALEQRDLADRLIRQHSPVKPSPLKSEIYRAGSVSLRKSSTMAPSVTSRDGGNDEDGDSSAYMHSPATLNNARANRWAHERFPTRR